MDKNKRILVVGFAALLVLGGLAMVVNAVVNAMNATDVGTQGMGGCSMRRGFPGHMNERMLLGNLTVLENLGLPENASREQVREALWQKELKDLGLNEDSTLREYRQAIEAKMQADQAKMQANQEERMQKIKEKLGLLENATQEDVMNAMKQWREENGRLPLGEGRGRGYGMQQGRCSHRVADVTSNSEA